MWNTEPEQASPIPYVAVRHRLSPAGDDPRPFPLPTGSVVYWINYQTKPEHAEPYDLWAAPNQEA